MTATGKDLIRNHTPPVPSRNGKPDMTATGKDRIRGWPAHNEN